LLDVVYRRLLPESAPLPGCEDVVAAVDRDSMRAGTKGKLVPGSTITSSQEMTMRMENLSVGMGYRASRYGYVKVSRHWTRLTLVEDLGMQPYGKNGRNQHRIECQCDCGNKTDVTLSALRSGLTRSCGCLATEGRVQRNLTHGQTGTRLYHTWAAMQQRCYNQNEFSYKDYGGRGINICDQWRTFEPFMTWALATGYTDTLTIERILNDGDYCPENCKWIPREEQARNTRANRLVAAWEEIKVMKAWAEDSRCRVPYPTLKGRLDRGWEPERAISQPPIPKTASRPRR
jgi:hypothetical protein